MKTWQNFNLKIIMKNLLSLVTIMTLMAVSAQAATVWWCGTRYGGNDYYTNGFSWKQSGVDDCYGSPPLASDQYGLISCPLKTT